LVSFYALCFAISSLLSAYLGIGITGIAIFGIVVYALAIFIAAPATYIRQHQVAALTTNYSWVIHNNTK